MGIGKNIKKILKENEMTIAELSQKSGVSINTLYSITKRDPDTANYDTIKKIADTLGCLTMDIFDENKIPLYATYDTLKELHGDNDIVLKLNSIAYNLEESFDDYTMNYTLIYPDGLLKISEDDLKKLDLDTDEYLRFKLEQFKQEHIKDFKPYKK